MDRDNTGAIGENEFVEYFKRLRAEDIRSKLKSLAAHDPVKVEVITYSAMSESIVGLVQFCFRPLRSTAVMSCLLSNSCGR